MSLIIATGSNLGDPINNLTEAKTQLSQNFELIASSRIYKSAAVDYENQPDFFNQVLEFSLPASTPQDVMKKLLTLEANMGRTREKWRGPRLIDMDIIFWGIDSYNSMDLIIPHPRWQDRSFVVKPLMELPFFQTIKKYFIIPESFKVDAFPL